jgi:hypothetical protein
MSFATALRRAPGRIAAGAFILNSGLNKLRETDEEHAKMLHSSAANAYPVVKDMEPKTFVKLLGAGETALGATLLMPAFPAGMAGLGLAGFSGTLLGFYWRTPGMHESADPRPTQHGTPFAKDVWMFGIGAGLVIDALTTRRRKSKAKAKAKPSAKAKLKSARA